MTYTKDDVRAIVAALTVCYDSVGRPLPAPETIKALWIGALEARGVPASVVVEALAAHALDPERGQYAPKPADVIRQLSAQANAAIAWSKVLEAVRRHGSGASVVFDDPRIAPTVQRMGGWVRLCETLVEDRLAIDGAEFRRIYDHVAANPQEVRGESQLLRGRSAEYDEAMGRLRPALIGDAAEAQRILELNGGRVAAELPRVGERQG